MAAQPTGKTPKTSPLQGLIHSVTMAAETYKKVLGTLSNKPEAARIRQIANDHNQALTTLRSLAGDGGGAQEAPAAWAGNLAGDVLGDAAALSALRDGEDRLVKDIETALQDPNVTPEMRTALESNILVKAKAHMTVLDALLGSVKPAK